METTQYRWTSAGTFSVVSTSVAKGPFERACWDLKNHQYPPDFRTQTWDNHYYRSIDFLVWSFLVFIFPQHLFLMPSKGQLTCSACRDVFRSVACELRRTSFSASSMRPACRPCNAPPSAGRLPTIRPLPVFIFSSWINLLQQRQVYDVSNSLVSLTSECPHLWSEFGWFSNGWLYMFTIDAQNETEEFWEVLVCCRIRVEGPRDWPSMRRSKRCNNIWNYWFTCRSISHIL